MDSFFTPTGRVARRRYLILFLIFFFVNLLALLIMYESYIEKNWLFFILNGIVLVFTIYVLIVQSIKRLHDLGYEWKYALLLLIFPLNFFGFIYLSWRDGQPGENKYGKDPMEEDVLTNPENRNSD